MRMIFVRFLVYRVVDKILQSLRCKHFFTLVLIFIHKKTNKYTVYYGREDRHKDTSGSISDHKHYEGGHPRRTDSARIGLLSCNNLKADCCSKDPHKYLRDPDDQMGYYGNCPGAPDVF